MKPLLLGLRRRDDTAGPALEPGPSGSGRRLLQLSGLPIEQYEAAYERANAADAPDLRDRRVIVLGRGAWQRLGLKPAPWFSTVRHNSAVLTLIPHPSGKCRLYNDPAVQQRAREVLLKLLDVGNRN